MSLTTEYPFPFDAFGTVHSLDQALQNPLAIKIRKQIVKALAEYKMIRDGDKVLVCVSGGKDSSILLTLLNEIRRRSPINFTVEAAILDQKQPGFEPDAFFKFIDGIGVKLHVIERDTYSIVKEKVQGKVYCSLCSRLRRGILYDFAHENGFTKMALGHHRDDLIETLLLNLFYTGKMSSMPPKLRSDDGRNILIRPMSFVAESDLKDLTRQWNFPIVPCNLCGSQEGLKRQKMKALLTQLEQEIPVIRQSLLTSIGNVKPSQLMDPEIWNFADLETADWEALRTQSQDDFLSGE
jgi:tRNA 2-thiocytidine biosynthesis protein TtcA